MIYTASYFDKNSHRGDLVSISLSLPSGVERHRDIAFDLHQFKPTRDMLKIPEAEYIPKFWTLMEQRRRLVEDWLGVIRPEVDMTLLCWEPPGKFCHRNLVLKIVAKYRPDCLGGADVGAIAIQSSLF